MRLYKGEYIFEHAARLGRYEDKQERHRSTSRSPIHRRTDGWTPDRKPEKRMDVRPRDRDGVVEKTERQTRPKDKKTDGQTRLKDRETDRKTRPKDRQTDRQDRKTEKTKRQTDRQDRKTDGQTRLKDRQKTHAGSLRLCAQGSTNCRLTDPKRSSADLVCHAGPSSVHCCFTCTETRRLIRDGGVQDGHHDFHTAPEL